MMLKNLNGETANNQSGFQEIIWLFIIAQFADFIIKHIPIVIKFIETKISAKLEATKNILENVTKDTTDNKYKTKTSSITVYVSISDSENIVGQALLDYITNNKNTLHVAYTKRNFIINQTDVINLEDDIFVKMSHEQEITESSEQKIIQTIEIYSFTKTTEDLRKFLETIKTAYLINIKNKLGNKRFFFNLHPISAPKSINSGKDYSKLPPNFVFVMKEFQTNRKFTNLFGEEIESIRNRVEFFIKNKKWYDEKGIPYTLGLLLSGAPGTGKTSTIKCLANETKRHIFNINLNNDITKIQFENLFFNETIHVINHQTMQNETYSIPLNQRIYVLEDVDCQSNIVKERTSIPQSIPIKSSPQNDNNERNYKQNSTSSDEIIENTLAIDLSFLLNLLDGILENPGRIIIMTSNLPDTLDSALIRPGRIDIISKFKKCTNNTIIQMIQFFYDIKLSNNEIEDIKQLNEEIITPANLGKVMFENFHDHKLTIQYIINLSNKILNEDILIEPEPISECEYAVNTYVDADDEHQTPTINISSTTDSLTDTDKFIKNYKYLSDRNDKNKDKIEKLYDLNKLELFKDAMVKTDISDITYKNMSNQDDLDNNLY